MSQWTYFDRDISWLSFNERVLMEAADHKVPLMERFKFLSIFSSNLDEFYRVRMPAILAMAKISGDKSGSVYNQAKQIIDRQQSLFGAILNNELLPLLASSGYKLLLNEVIPESLHAFTSEYFFNHIAGLLQPVAVNDNSDFFPENNKLYLAAIAQKKDEEEACYLINIPGDILPRFIKIENNNITYLLFLEDIIKQYLHWILQGKIKGAYNIKITRDAALDFKDDYDEDLAEKIEKQLAKRDKGFATRFLYEPEIPLRHLEYLIDVFKMQKASVVEGGHYHNLKDLGSLPVHADGLANIPQPALKRNILSNKTATLFDKIAGKDMILHVPYDSYEPVLRLFNEAAIHPDVEEINTTLYRMAADSRIAQALISAAKNGKRVLVLVELKARFDEANNIRWAKKMKDAGVKIIYSENQIKVHAKVALIKRKHVTTPLLGLLATGNLNESTARFYTDHILLTARQEILEELSSLFVWLEKKKAEKEKETIRFHHLLVAQFNLLEEFINLIDKEISNAKQGLPASITIKLNNLEEETLISKLYEASNAGIKIQLIVRSICRLVPGVTGQSENIAVRRIVDRYLEHGRIFIFGNNGDTKIFLGSSDWMNRNIYRRIEVCFPVYDKDIQNKIIKLVDIQLADNVKAVCINNQLENVPVTQSGNAIRSQEVIYNFLKAQ